MKIRIKSTPPGEAPEHIRQASERKPDWKTHFNWLRKKTTKDDMENLNEFEQERGRQAAREIELGDLK